MFFKRIHSPTPQWIATSTSGAVLALANKEGEQWSVTTPVPGQSFLGGNFRTLEAALEHIVEIAGALPVK